MLKQIWKRYIHRSTQCWRGPCDVRTWEKCDVTRKCKDEARSSDSRQVCALRQKWLGTNRCSLRWQFHECLAQSRSRAILSGHPIKSPDLACFANDFGPSQSLAFASSSEHRLLPGGG